MKALKWMSVLTALIMSATALSGQEIRQIKFTEDDDQTYMVSKIYELKHVKAADLTPFIKGAVKRRNSQSKVSRCNYKKQNQQFLVVSTADDMIPYVDEMIEKLDRPCGKKNEYGSIIDGTGVHEFVYRTKHRASEDMREIAVVIIGSSDGEYYLDQTANMFYWKDSYSDGTGSMEWFEVLDRPVPQLDISLNVYEINENDFTELGIDYVSWKNGPGAELFSAGFDFFDFDYFSDMSNSMNPMNLVGDINTPLSGFAIAPNIDATFIRMLSQKGKAKIATSGKLTVINDYTSTANSFEDAEYKIRFTPNYQIITKNSDVEISVDSAPEDFYFYLTQPSISYGGNPGKQTRTVAGTIKFGWNLSIQDTVEETNIGTPVNNSYEFNSNSTLKVGTEKLLASFTKELDVSQDNGMPYLNDIPGFKYLFGASVESESKTHVFITIEAKPVSPETSPSKWAQGIVEADADTDSE